MYLHWSWLLFGLVRMQFDTGYSSRLWTLIEYIGLFVIVLMHEFGHALATKSVGGQAEHIVLWPLGGIAFVNAPPRPGAVLWSIIAGPLVNVVLLPVLWGVAIFAMLASGGIDSAEEVSTMPDFVQLLFWLAVINTGLLVFNMLPIYPLDGGQTLQALLWFAIGRAKSLRIAAGLGMTLSVFLAGVAMFLLGSIWLVVIALFLGFQAYQGFRIAAHLPPDEQIV